MRHHFASLALFPFFSSPCLVFRHHLGSDKLSTSDANTDHSSFQLLSCVAFILRCDAMVVNKAVMDVFPVQGAQMQVRSREREMSGRAPLHCVLVFFSQRILWAHLSRLQREHACVKCVNIACLLPPLFRSLLMPLSRSLSCVALRRAQTGTSPIVRFQLRPRSVDGPMSPLLQPHDTSWHPWQQPY